MADGERNKLVLELVFEALERPLHPCFRGGVRMANAQELLGGAAENLMVLVKKAKGARRIHDGKVASKDMDPGIGAV